MKIIDIKTEIVKAPLKNPFKTALRTVEHLESLIVTIYTDNGLVGYGEGASTAVITGEVFGSIRFFIEDLIKDRLLYSEIENFNSLLNIIDSTMVHNSTTKSTIQMALYDLRSQSLGVPLYKLLGGGKTDFETDITISLNDIETMINDSQKAIELGYNILKIKVGESISKDYERIKTIANSFPNITLRIDANQAWSPKDTIRVLNKLESQGIFAECIEQPVKANDFRGMRYIKNRTLTPLLADEAIFSPKNAIELLEMDACDLINIKLAKCGGISHALQIADIAKLYNVKCMMGCMLEGAISITSALHVVSARSEVITMLDLDGVNLLAYNPIVGGAEFNESQITLSNKNGLGVEGIKV